MDELLHERVKQLAEIDDRLERMLRRGFDDPFKAAKDVRELRLEIAAMIQEAERQHSEF